MVIVPTDTESQDTMSRTNTCLTSFSFVSRLLAVSHITTVSLS